MKKRTMTIIVAVLVVAVVAVFAYIQLTKPVETPQLNHKPGDYIITNIYGSARLMKLTPVLVFEGIPEKVQAEVTEYLTLNEPIIRDIIIFVIRAMEETELREPGVENVVTQRILAQLKQRLSFADLEDASKKGITLDNLTDINYYDFVLQ